MRLDPGVPKPGESRQERLGLRLRRPEQGGLGGALRGVEPRARPVGDPLGARDQGVERRAGTGVVPLAFQPVADVGAQPLDRGVLGLVAIALRLLDAAERIGPRRSADSGGGGHRVREA